MEQTSNRKIIILVIIVIAMIFLVIGFSFSFFRYSRLSTTSSVIQAGQMMFGYIEEINGISLVNAVPISDEDAMSTVEEGTYFDFYITYSFSKTSTLTYEIDIEDITDELEEVQNGTLQKLDASRIKVALENRTVPLPNENEKMVVAPQFFANIQHTVASNGKKGYKLFEKKTTGKGKDFYRLYLWIPEYDVAGEGIPLIDTETSSGIANQSFSVRINVQSNVEVN